MGLVMFLISCGASVLGNVTTGTVKKITDMVSSMSLESLFIDTFFITLDQHDKHYDKTSRRFTQQLRTAVKRNPTKLLHIFARNSDNLQTFLSPIGKREFQRKVAQEIVTEFSLDLSQTDGMVESIVVDCLRLYQKAFIENMSQQQALQTILLQTLKIDTIFELLKHIRSQIKEPPIQKLPTFGINPPSTITLKSSTKLSGVETGTFEFSIPVLDFPHSEIQISSGRRGNMRLKLEIPENILEQLFIECLDRNPKLQKLAIERLQAEYIKTLADAKSVCFFANLSVPDSFFIGRDDCLETLDSAWNERKTSIISIVAWGGVGKTALVNYWLNHRMANDNFKGAEKVFGWSFYSQGTKERVTSADKFISEALAWFGDTDPKEGSPWDKGVRLAELIRRQRTLLILDGLEPLQYPPGPMQGQLKDQGLQALLKELVRSNPGLCIITTRQKVKDIEHASDSNLKRIFLDNLSVEDGVQLLKSLGVNGTDNELREAVEDFEGHALALNLLGTHLATVHEGDIRKLDLVPRLTEKEEQGGHARRVMESYEIWLKETPELDILYLIGLFDRPAPGGAIDELRKEPAIKGLTDKLQGLSETNWQYAVKHLRDLRLLGQRDENEPEKLDCHPLVREHFGEKLQKGNPKAWQEAHSRLYEYYKGLPEKEYPDTLEEMEPLFAAVTHGCLAERHQETFYDVYWKHILRSNDFYSTNKLGAFGTDLAAVSCFFEKPWSRPTSGLTDEAKAALLNYAGFALRALGRLTEAAEPMKADAAVSVSQKDWRGAATAAGNLSELYLTLGDVEQSITYARQAIEQSDKIDDFFQKEVSRYQIATALHNFGEITESHNMFVEAETIQKENQPEYPYLYSVQGFWYCDLLLTIGQYEEVQKRARQILDIGRSDNVLLEIALGDLSLGRAYLLESIAEKTGDPSAALRTSLRKAADFLNQAVDGLREAGTQHHIPRGLFARAQVYRYQQSWEKAWADLEEAAEIAERGQMNLWLADYHLEAARLCLAEGKFPEAREHYKEAAKRIQDMGYHRRSPELMLIQAELEIVEGNKNHARETLKTAERRINKMGYHRWDIEVERLQSKL